MNILQWLGVISPAHISWFNAFNAKKCVGEDGFGNRYYIGKARKGYQRERRWVIYKGAPEASSVPPEWHAWLHHQSDVVPAQQGKKTYRRSWQKPYQPNMTGTNKAYRPSGHVLAGGKRDSATGDYEAWTPSSSANR